ncbi:hypothetical protein JG688_00018486 [Phytophthora aleatoria]|uniref:Uncharacterized protein n=1 Tax=Phytophthora aleatoria TaxID=2496075 RepID=A0A8J5IW68_9STRA|nr:hypothetical protein JG688_00018486 [Phytophthora aleatoria]
MPPPKKRRHGSTPLASRGMIARIVTGIRPGRDDCARSSSTRCRRRHHGSGVGGVPDFSVEAAGWLGQYDDGVTLGWILLLNFLGRQIILTL